MTIYISVILAYISGKARPGNVLSGPAGNYYITKFVRWFIYIFGGTKTNKNFV